MSLSLLQPQAGLVFRSGPEPASAVTVGYLNCVFWRESVIALTTALESILQDVTRYVPAD